MSKRCTRAFLLKMSSVLMLFCLASCKKQVAAEDAKIKPPIRVYDIIARIDKKGANTDSKGTAVLKGRYDEATKKLSYALEYEGCVPQVITLRNGPKGSAGSLIKELYNKDTAPGLSGTFTLSPLQERNMLKGLWFVAVNTALMSPEISGVLTFKQR